VNKGNFFRFLWKFYTAHIQPLDPHVDRLAQWMLQTGHYIPATTWATPQGGHGVSMFRAPSIWVLMNKPHEARLRDVQATFFYTPAFDWDSLRPPHLPDPYDFGVEEAMAMAVQARDGQAVPRQGRLTPLLAVGMPASPLYAVSNAAHHADEDEDEDDV